LIGLATRMGLAAQVAGCAWVDFWVKACQQRIELSFELNYCA
jgi:hypothetical protein